MVVIYPLYGGKTHTQRNVEEEREEESKLPRPTGGWIWTWIEIKEIAL